ncbi:MAG TPA: metallophosphoesterase [Salinimicrobium sp.]|nr:metallophosphoesterase [Salinimicrobium sp.]
MKKNNIFLTVLVLLLSVGCAVKGPKYAKDEKTADFGYPKNKEIEKTFYLLGDGGNSSPENLSPGMRAFKTVLDTAETEGDVVMFLGDNIYPAGMPPPEHPNRKHAEIKMKGQLSSLSGFDGKVMFIPGNHDWYINGIKGLEDQKEFIEENYDGDFYWAPPIGTGLEVLDISDDIQMIVIDSQWYLEDWNEHPLVNENAEEIKTRADFFLEIESELKKGQNKTVIFALHHPLLTNGLHGGEYSFHNHIYPTQSVIPLPILGSLAMLIRTSGGVSIQDAQNEQYKSLVNRLITLAEGSERVIFVSGHEHNLQYLINDVGIKQIVSGSGSKSSYVSVGMNGLFAYEGEGFAVYDVFKDGSSWVSFYGNENGVPKLYYQKEVFKAPEEFDVSILPDEFPTTIEASVYEPDKTEKSDVYESIWGDRYRALYGTPVEVKVAELDTLYGGLEVIRKGGGHQTRTLRLKDSLDREYNMRAIEKSAVQFLQTVAYKNEPIAERFKNTLAEDIIFDFYTSAHPYGFMTIPTLSEAAGIFHTNPDLFYIPKQKALGKYNEEYGGELYMIEERPEENWVGTEGIFGNPNHDIESTAGLYARLRRDEKYKLDEDAYIRARLFDMLVGDWDRHEDQWRWHESEDEEGNRRMLPIPRDRDQVYSNFDGAFLGTLRGLFGMAKQFVTYSEDIENIKWFNRAALGMDRSLIQNKGRESWIREAKYLQEHITDEVIEEAFSHLPKETQGKSAKEIIRKLKGRRGNLVSIAERYYDYLAELSIITGTDKDDYIEVKRLDDGKTEVIVRRLKGGNKADLISQKIYNADETKELWIYGLADDDIFEVNGTGSDPIKVRIIGGQNNDVYRIKTGHNVKVYDHATKPNTIEQWGEAKFRFADDYEVNVYNKDKNILSNSALIPAFGYNPDDGFKLGIRSIRTLNGFKRNPFTAQHRFGLGYFFGTKGFYLNYESEFAHIVGNYNLLVGANYTDPNYGSNFFGIGNETYNPEDELGKDYNRTRISTIGVQAGLQRQSVYGSFFRYLATFEGIKVEETPGRFIDQFANDALFERKYFAGLEGTFRYESYDDILNPTNGLYFDATAGTKLNTSNTDNAYGYINSAFEIYNALIRNRKLVLKTHLNGQFLIGKGYEFYQAAVLGGETGLRGYRSERFAGQSAFAAGGDLRYSFDKFRTKFLPFQIGVFAGYDIGRVWIDDGDSEKWHDSYGGGFWVNGASAINGTFSLFRGSEGWRFSFGFGFKF